MWFFVVAWHCLCALFDRYQSLYRFCWTNYRSIIFLRTWHSLSFISLSHHTGERSHRYIFGFCPSTLQGSTPVTEFTLHPGDTSRGHSLTHLRLYNNARISFVERESQGGRLAIWSEVRELCWTLETRTTTDSFLHIRHIISFQKEDLSFSLLSLGRKTKPVFERFDSLHSFFSCVLFRRYFTPILWLQSIDRMGETWG